MQIIDAKSPAAQASTDSFALVAGSILNATLAQSVAITIKNTGANSIDWRVDAGNASDLSDGVTVQNSAAVAANATASYSVQIAPFSYYGVYIKATSGGSQGAGTVKGRAKG